MLLNTVSIVIFTLNFTSVTDFLNIAIFIPNGIDFRQNHLTKPPGAVSHISQTFKRKIEMKIADYTPRDHNCGF